MPTVLKSGSLNVLEPYGLVIGLHRDYFIFTLDNDTISYTFPRLSNRERHIPQEWNPQQTTSFMTQGRPQLFYSSAYASGQEILFSRKGEFITESMKAYLLPLQFNPYVHIVFLRDQF